MARNPSTNDIIEEVHDYCIDLKNRTIFLHGHTLHTDEDPGTEFRMANRFLKNMLILGAESSEERILIHQHNIGGYWESGMIVYDTICNSQSRVVMVCHGEIMSMGTVILQSPDLRVSMPNCWFMLHHGYTDMSPFLTHVASQSASEYEKKISKLMLQMYAESCKDGEFFKDKNERQIKTFLDNKFKSKGDWFLNAEEAKYYGFIDKIIGEDCDLQDI